MDPPLFQAPLAPLAVSRPIFHRPQSVQDWETQKARITDLYESNELKDTIKIMEEQHGFKATVNQYKKQLGKWGLDNKRIKDFEYQAMLRKKRKRKQEDPHKESAFRLRGAEVDSSKISRYKKRKGVNEEDVTSDIGTPSDLSCYTPSLISCSPAPPSPMPLSIADVNTNGHTGLGTGITSIDRGIIASIYFDDPFAMSFNRKLYFTNVRANGHVELESDTTNSNASNSVWNPSHLTPSIFKSFETFDSNDRTDSVLERTFVHGTSLSSLVQDLRSYGYPYTILAGAIERCCSHEVLGFFPSSFEMGSCHAILSDRIYYPKIEGKVLTDMSYHRVKLRISKAELFHDVNDLIVQEDEEEEEWAGMVAMVHARGGTSWWWLKA